MYTYHFKLRAKSTEDAEIVCRFYRQSLQLIPKPGFVRGTYAIGYEDRRTILIEQHWGSLPALQAWLSSDTRRQLIAEIADLVDGPGEISIYEESPA